MRRLRARRWTALRNGRGARVPLPGRQRAASRDLRCRRQTAAAQHDRRGEGARRLRSHRSGAGLRSQSGDRGLAPARCRHQRFVDGRWRRGRPQVALRGPGGLHVRSSHPRAACVGRRAGACEHGARLSLGVGRAADGRGAVRPQHHADGDARLRPRHRRSRRGAARPARAVAGHARAMGGDHVIQSTPVAHAHAVHWAWPDSPARPPVESVSAGDREHAAAARDHARRPRSRHGVHRAVVVRRRRGGAARQARALRRYLGRPGDHPGGDTRDRAGAGHGRVCDVSLLRPDRRVVLPGRLSGGGAADDRRSAPGHQFAITTSASASAGCPRLSRCLC